MNGKVRKAIRRAKRKSWRDYMSKMSHMTSTKNVWDMFNRVKGKSSNERNVVLDDREKGCQFLNMIANVRNDLNEVMLPENENDVGNYMTVEFEWEEFLRALANTKSNTPGTNRVTCGMIGRLNSETKLNLLSLLNKGWVHVEIPEK